MPWDNRLTHAHKREIKGEKQMKKKIIAIIAILLVISSGSAYYFLSYVPHQEAVTSYNKAVKKVKATNKTLQVAIDEAEKLVKSNQQPLDAKSLDNL